MRKKILISLISIMLMLAIFSWNKIKANTDNSTLEEVEENVAQELESTRYIINNNQIYRVVPGTEIEIFKKKFNIPENIKIYKDNTCAEEVTTGIVGTGMILKNMTDGKTYEISVIGDFNKDGKISQIELSRVIRHVVGLNEYKLSGILLKSADINNDNVVNQIDITLLIRYNVYGELDIEENEEIKSPTIDIISGNMGKNDWYTSQVKFTITPAENNEDIMGKTTYKITGTKETEEREIKIGEEITLDDGTYQISAYTYSKTGFKSLATRKTIKIDMTKPESGTLEMYLNDEQGEKYVENTWTNSNVLLSLADGKDEGSGHYKTTYYVENSKDILPGTVENKTLSENGTYKAIVETEDNAGNISNREYIIKIDKNATSKPEIKIISGNKNEGSNWYNEGDVVLQVIEGVQGEGASKIIKTTYEIKGSINTDEIEIQNEGTIIIKENGIYNITAYSYNEAGQKSEGTTITIKKDDTIPNSPKIEIIEGTQGKNNWYISNVVLKVTKPDVDEELSPIQKITYKIEGASTVEETEIENLGTININVDGISKISVYAYNEAGQKSEAATIEIKKDASVPSKSIVSAKDITSERFTLVGEAEDKHSGILTYEFYLEDELIKTIETTKKNVEVPVKDKKSGIYKTYIIVKDEAGNSLKSEEIEVKTARIEESKVDYVEFVVTDFTLKNSSNETVQKGATATISDTSLTTTAKYIMINATEENITANVTGKIRLVCIDGSIVEELDYFPENLIINMAYYTNGSGTSFTHEKQANFFGININSGNVGEGTTVNTPITISNSNVTENKFTITEKKLTGTQTYIRATIQSMMLNGENINFRIVQE